MDEPFEVLNKIRKSHLSDVDFKKDAQRVRAREEWKQNRSDILSDRNVCEWCGQKPERGFDIHHTWGKSFSRQWDKATDEAFVESNSYDPSLTNNRQECPSCALKDYYERKTKTPRYRCNNCGEEFNEPKEIDGGEAIADDNYNNKPYADFPYYEAKAEWVDENRDKVRHKFERRYQNLLDEYAELKDSQVVAICRKCHYKEEKTKKRLCPVCESNWYNPKRGSDNMCWDCLVEKKGLENCPDCSDGWYQPDKYDSCSDCR